MIAAPRHVYPLPTRKEKPVLIICADAEGFEDQLTAGKEYKAFDIKNGSVEIRNDNGVAAWYGLSKFSFIAS